MRKLLCIDLPGLGDFRRSVLRDVIVNWDLTIVTSIEEALSLPGFDEYFLALVFIGTDNRGWISDAELEALSATQLSLVALLSPETIRQGPVRDLIANHFRDYHTLPVDSSRLLATLGHAHGMAVLRAHAFLSAEGKSRREVDLSRLVAYIQNLREAERSRIARDVHDELGQTLTAIKLKLISIRERKAPISLAVKTDLDSLEMMIESVINTTQRIVTELRPAVLDTLDIADACHWLVERVERRFGLNCSCSCDGLTVNIDDEQRTALFRILQEALTNVTRHARATECAVILGNCGSELVLTVDDNGIGFDSSAIGPCQSLGLLSMQERAALLGGKTTIESRPRTGTRVEVRIPLTSLKDETDFIGQTCCS